MKSEPASVMPPPPPLPESQPLPTEEPSFAPSPKPKPAGRREPPSPAPSQPAETLPVKAAPKAENNANAALLDPATYPAIWQKVLGYFHDICRIDIWTCYQKGVLLYLTPQRSSFLLRSSGWYPPETTNRTKRWLPRLFKKSSALPSSFMSS